MVILVDSEPTSPTKSQGTWSPRPGSSQVGSSQAPASRYGVVARSPEAASPIPPPAYSQAANVPLLPAPQQKPTRRTAATKRFCSAFSIALVILLVTTTLGNILFAGYEVVWENDPRPEDGNIVTCSKHWSDPVQVHAQGAGDEAFDSTMIPGFPVFTASKSYTLPINKSLHYIVAHGSLSSGVVNIRSNNAIDPGYVDVKVVANYWTEEALSYSQVCELRKPEGGVGLGIYTPSGRFSPGRGLEQRITWTVTVTFPTTSRSILELNAFATNMDNFRHSIEGLGRVHFEHLSLKGSNGPIESDGLSVSQATIVTSNSKITGKFSTDDSLTLKTTNGAIDADVDVTNDDTHKASTLELTTSNARIASRISLLTAHGQRPQPKGGHFTVKATTSNGRLDISYPTSPVNSLLDFNAESSNGSADIALHAAYEGTFALSTSNSHIELDDEHPSDPSGRGRNRDVHKNGGRSSRQLSGTIFWGDEKDHDKNAETGRVIVSTSNSWARLRLL
ncbi:transmembrane protein, putative [Rhizoctonia solani AG-3 Rhs1AP]|uniref:Transmembrane protein, putative n=1 Tax=Rhizoctonia solani AG-3 Rhs1AP TaxID=1086054 RepID=X8JFM1_9AGAM|nr:transmembrane protein, putative [Rhizoctonia solani AG-3 Rhs1AP]